MRQDVDWYTFLLILLITTLSKKCSLLSRHTYGVMGMICHYLYSMKLVIVLRRTTLLVSFVHVATSFREPNMHCQLPKQLRMYRDVQ